MISRIPLSRKLQTFQHPTSLAFKCLQRIDNRVLQAEQLCHGGEILAQRSRRHQAKVYSCLFQRSQKMCLPEEQTCFPPGLCFRETRENVLLANIFHEILLPPFFFFLPGISDIREGMLGLSLTPFPKERPG